MARRLDSSLSLTGEPLPVAESIGGSSNFHTAFSVSNTGVLALEKASGGGSELVWFTRAGASTGKITSLTEYVDFELSPNQQQIAIAEVDGATEHSAVSVRDIRKGNSLRLTYSQVTDASPVWSPDGARIAFRSNRSGRHDLYLWTLAVGARRSCCSRMKPPNSRLTGSATKSCFIVPGEPPGGTSG